MKRLLLFGTGAAFGYVLGARAGRGRYDEIMRLVGAVPDHTPGSLADLADNASMYARDLTDAARGKAHDVIDIAATKVEATADSTADRADRKVDQVADLADEVTRQTQERLKP